MCISPFLWLLNGLYFFSDELYKLADHLYCQEAKKEDWCDEVKKKEGSKEPQKRQAKNKATRFFFFFCTLVGSPENFPKREVPVSSLDTSTGKTI